MTAATGDRSATAPRGRQLTAYIVGAVGREFPSPVLDAAKRALVDFLGVAIGASHDVAVRPVRRMVQGWNAAGNSRIFLGGRTTPALAALVNATMAHAMDYDDTHLMGGGHLSGPCWSTALAVTEHYGLDEKDAIASYVTGFEVMARLGGGGVPGVGRNLQRRGFFPTSVFGRVAAAAAASVLMRLDETRIAYALGAAATTAGGLLDARGTHSKPFQAGKAAMDGILAAQLASEGLVSTTHLFEQDKGLLDVLIQDRVVEVPPFDFEKRWELLRNGFKPYASVRSSHAAIQAARSLASRVGASHITKVHARVHPDAIVTAGKLAPRTPLEGKFSLPFCIALGLRGYRVVASDFSDHAMRDASVAAVIPMVKLEAVDGQAPYSAHLDVELQGGEWLHADTEIVMGHPDNPMTWDDLRTKFEGLVEPVLGPQKTATLYELARGFEQPDSLKKISGLLADHTSVNQ